MCLLTHLFSLRFLSVVNFLEYDCVNLEASLNDFDELYFQLSPKSINYKYSILILLKSSNNTVLICAFISFSPF